MTQTHGEFLPCIERKPVDTPTHSIIWLHGLGADGHDFAPIVDQLDKTITNQTRFIFPHAPMIPVTINGGYIMPAWFDIYGVQIDSKIDKKGILKSASTIEKLIEREITRGIASHHIFLAGFSQGAVIALTTGLCYPQPLAGIIALSGYLPLSNEVLAARSEVNQSIPIFIAHGTQDPIVPFVLGQATQSILHTAGYPVDWHTYAMQHSVCAEEINAINDWMRKVLEKR